MKNLCVIALCFLFVTSCKQDAKKVYFDNNDIEQNDTKPVDKKIISTAEAIAKANGMDNWEKVKEINFTFNMDIDSSHYERSWNWKPKKNEVIFTSEKDTIAYNRNNIDNASLRTDQGFINDKFWLLTPFNLVWDQESYTSEHKVKSIAPISGKEMHQFTIVYNKGGYTPGDAYDFYFEGDFRIKEWVFRKQNKKEPSLITSWEDYEDFEGIKIAKTYHRKEDGWKLYFSNIKVILE